MSLEAHLNSLFTLLSAWEAEIQERLSYIPKDFKDFCFKYLSEYLLSIEKELKADIGHITEGRKNLKNICNRKVTIQIAENNQ